jgi:hypothetical protein
MWFSQFRQSAVARRRSWQRARCRPTSARLVVEALEDRAVPAQLTPVLAPDLVPGLFANSEPGVHGHDHAADGNVAQHSAPWKLRGEGEIMGINPDGSLAMAWTGNSTLLGRFTATGVLAVAANGIDFSVSGTYTAANGDQIHFTSQGAFEHPLGTVDVNSGTGTAIITGGTGRFANATGNVLFSGILNADGTFKVQHDFGHLNW